MMEVRYRPRFKREYKKLPAEIQDTTDARVKIFTKNPFDSRLKTHKLRGDLVDFFAFSVNYRYRILFDFVDSDIAEFYSIGDHDIYE